jgi:hypothetical protein
MAKKRARTTKKMKKTKTKKKTKKMKRVRKPARKAKRKKKVKKTKRKVKKVKKTKKARSTKKVSTPKTPKRAKSKAKPVTMKKKAITATAARVTERIIGKVVHYYDRIGVAIIDLKKPLRIGETITLQKGDQTMPQRVTSMQIEHLPVASAQPGDVIGLKVDHEAPEGTLVLPA